jgi:hypothetical protein
LVARELRSQELCMSQCKEFLQVCYLVILPIIALGNQSSDLPIPCFLVVDLCSVSVVFEDCLELVKPWYSEFSVEDLQSVASVFFSTAGNINYSPVQEVHWFVVVHRWKGSLVNK